MNNIDPQIWVWLILSIFVVVLSLWAIVDGIRDYRWTKRAKVSDEDVRAMLTRHIRNGALIFIASNLAGFIGILLILGYSGDNPALLATATLILPFVLNFILGTYAVILAWNRIDRRRLIRRRKLREKE